MDSRVYFDQQFYTSGHLTGDGGTYTLQTGLCNIIIIQYRVGMKATEARVL